MLDTKGKRIGDDAQYNRRSLRRSSCHFLPFRVSHGGPGPGSRPIRAPGPYRNTSSTRLGKLMGVFGIARVQRALRHHNVAPARTAMRSSACDATESHESGTVRAPRLDARDRARGMQSLPTRAPPPGQPASLDSTFKTVAASRAAPDWRPGDRWLYGLLSAPSTAPRPSRSSRSGTSTAPLLHRPGRRARSLLHHPASMGRTCPRAGRSRAG